MAYSLAFYDSHISMILIFIPSIFCDIIFFFGLGFMRELRDDVGIGRLWNLMSRYFFFLFTIRTSVGMEV